MRPYRARTYLGIGLTLLLAQPAWAFDVDRFLAAAAKQPQVEIAAAESAAESAAARQAALMPPWEMGLRQEGIGPTDPANQISQISLASDLDPVGWRAAQSRAQTLRAESLMLHSRQLRLDMQHQDLATAWRVLALRAQIKALDGALADLPEWQRRIRLRVEAGKLPGMVLTRFLGVETEWRTRKLNVQRELATTEVALAAQGLLELVDGPLPALQAMPKAGPPAEWPEAAALKAEERSLQLAEEAVRKQAFPQMNLMVEAWRYQTLANPQHAIAAGIGWNLPNTTHLQLEHERIAKQHEALAARQSALHQRQRALLGRYEALYRTGLAEWTELQQQLIPNLDRQAQQTQSLIERGLSDVWPWVDLRRTQLEASLQAIDAHAAALEGGYGLWLLATGSSSH
jgi:hypothetical protein